jgi:hypothetical protein
MDKVQKPSDSVYYVNSLSSNQKKKSHREPYTGEEQYGGKQEFGD